MDPMFVVVLILEIVLTLIAIWLLNDWLKSREREIIKRNNREMLDYERTLDDYDQTNCGG